MATGLRMEAAIFQIVAIFPDFQIVGRAWLHKIAPLWLDNGWARISQVFQLWAAHYYYSVIHPFEEQPLIQLLLFSTAHSGPANFKYTS